MTITIPLVWLITFGSIALVYFIFKKIHESNNGDVRVRPSTPRPRPIPPEYDSVRDQIRNITDMPEVIVAGVSGTGRSSNNYLYQELLTEWLDNPRPPRKKKASKKKSKNKAKEEKKKKTSKKSVRIEEPKKTVVNNTMNIQDIF